jgi:hypothetical protein
MVAVYNLRSYPENCNVGTGVVIAHCRTTTDESDVGVGSYSITLTITDTCISSSTTIVTPKAISSISVFKHEGSVPDTYVKTLSLTDFFTISDAACSFASC